MDESIADYTDDEFDDMLDLDIDAGEDTAQRFIALGNIKADATEEPQKRYLSYLNKIMDAAAVESVNYAVNTMNNQTVVNPEGILYLTANSSSGSKYYDLTAKQQTYVAGRWQEDIPSYSVINITDTKFTVNTYRTDTNKKIDTEFTIIKKQNSQNPEPPSTEPESSTELTSTNQKVSGENGSTTTQNTKRDTALPTGDSTNIILLSGLAICMGGAVFAAMLKKKNQE